MKENRLATEYTRILVRGSRLESGLRQEAVLTSLATPSLRSARRDETRAKRSRGSRGSPLGAEAAVLVVVHLPIPGHGSPSTVPRRSASSAASRRAAGLALALPPFDLGTRGNLAATTARTSTALRARSAYKT